MSRTEQKYDRFQRGWCKLPIVRNTGRLQALPFIVVFMICYAMLAHTLWWLIEVFGAQWDRSSKAALGAIGFMTGGFALFMTALVRSEMRQAGDLPH